MFERVRGSIEDAQSSQDSLVVQKGKIRFDAFLEWLRREVKLGVGVPKEYFYDDVMGEIATASRFKGGGDGNVEDAGDRGCVREHADTVDAEESAVRTAEGLVYGYPSRDADPTGVFSEGKFVKAFPLEFPMGVGDLYDSTRRRKVTANEWVQHLLRYHSGSFVGGMRGQRVL